MNAASPYPPSRWGRISRSSTRPRSATVALLAAALLLPACGQGSHNDDLILLEEEPPTPPPLEGVDATHLVAAFPQEPVRPGEVWVRPGSVSNLIRKQQPPEPEPPPPAEIEPPASDTPAPEATRTDTAAVAANEQLVAEGAGPQGEPKAPSAEPPRPSAEPPRPSAERRSAPAEAPAPAARRAPTPTGTPPAAARAAIAEPDRASAATPAPPTEPVQRESNNLSVARAALATKIEERQPVGISDTFTEGTKVYLYNMIINPGGEPILIHHKWYRGDERVAAVKLGIKAARWRTWSVIPVYGKGAWRVDIVEPSGRVIHSEKFTVN